jgi:glycosyltransferase involved in cell wall biosynthesis
VKTTALVTNSLSGGGAESTAQVLKKEFSNLGMSIVWIGVNSENPLNVPTDKNTLCLYRSKNNTVIETFLAYLNLIKVIRRKSVSTLILNCELPELLAAFIPFRLKLFVVEHANPTWYKRDLLGWIVRSVLKLRKAKFVVVGEHLKPRFAESLPTVTIRNPIMDNSVYSFQSYGKEIKRIVFVGRLSSEFKNANLIVEIAAKLKMDALFIGDGPLKQFLESESRSKGVEAKFLGFQRQPWNHFSKGDLLIIPSSAEGDGLVLIEAVQRGIPFLASNIPDLNRYGISEQNYCKSLNEYVSRIQQYRQSLFSLVVPRDLAIQILNQRDSSRIAQTWVKLLLA